MSALKGQVGGGHYSSMPYQPMELTTVLGLTPSEHTVVKYVSRYLNKGNPIQDLEKALHCLSLSAELDSRAPWPQRLMRWFDCRFRKEKLANEVEYYVRVNQLNTLQWDVLLGVVIRDSGLSEWKLKRLLEAEKAFARGKGGSDGRDD